MVKYDDLKMLCSINEDTFDAYKFLTSAIDENSRDLLYIYQTKNEANLKYNEIVEKFKYGIKKKDKQKGMIELNSKDNIYIWTINKAKRQIYGYKFRSIRIR